MLADCTRASKQIGDFGEGLATYALIRKGYEIAYVDHVGADLIAERNGLRFAVSVKTRLFRPGSKESQTCMIYPKDIRKLRVFADRFAMRPLLAQLVCHADVQQFHLFIIPADERMDSILPKTDKSYSIRFGAKNLSTLRDHPLVDYSLWTEAHLGAGDNFHAIDS